MKIVIDIPPQTWALVREGQIPVRAYECIVKGTPLRCVLDDDCISRQAVLEPYQTLKDSDTICIWLLRKNIEQQPPVTPKHKPCMSRQTLKDIDRAFKALEERDELLDKLRTEMDQKQYDFMESKDYDEGVRFGLMLAYQIIDKYAESEE